MTAISLYESEIATIKEIARDVYTTLGSGFDECVYENAMLVGLRLQGVAYESQRVVELKYRDHYVGEGYPDLIVHLKNDVKVIIELKAIAGSLGRPEEQQLKNYMRLFGLEHGLLVNFQQPSKAMKETTITLDLRDVCLNDETAEFR
jgi:GxxExxY protein